MTYSLLKLFSQVQKLYPQGTSVQKYLPFSFVAIWFKCILNSHVHCFLKPFFEIAWTKELVQVSERHLNIHNGAKNCQKHKQRDNATKQKQTRARTITDTHTTNAKQPWRPNPPYPTTASSPQPAPTSLQDFNRASSRARATFLQPCRSDTALHRVAQALNEAR